MEAVVQSDRKWSREDDAQLIMAAQAGDQDARNALVERHKPFVLWCCRKFRKKYPRYNRSSELLSDAVLAYMKAIDEFNPARGTRLNTYAATAIDRDLTKMAHEDRIVRVPAGTLLKEKIEPDTKAKALKALEPYTPIDRRSPMNDSEEFILTATPIIEIDHGRPTMHHVHAVREQLPIQWQRIVAMRSINIHLKQIAGWFGVSKERIRQIEEKAFSAIRQALGHDPNARHYWGSKRARAPIAPSKPDRAQAAAASGMTIDQLMDAVDQLTERQQTVILGRIEGQSQYAIAKSLGISGSRVRAVERAALCDLSKILKRHVNTISVWIIPERNAS